jgi:NAD(P)-dependent dehydrogenase (short-subunit alcohol dehydrogenase family)
VKVYIVYLIGKVHERKGGRIAMKSVVVTGVSTGIGMGATKVLVEKGFRVYGSVRRQADADRLSSELGPRFRPLIFDITDEDAARRAASSVESMLEGEALAGLVNNAGVAMPAPLIYQPIGEFKHQLEVNLVGPLIVTQAFVRLLRGDRGKGSAPGRIVNISSIGGKIAGPFIGAYHASKFGLEGLSDCLRRELLLHGIDVIVIGPGGVRTAIWDKAKEADMSAYAATEYGPSLEPFRTYMMNTGLGGHSPEYLGRVIHKALTARHPKTRYGFSVVPHPLGAWVLPRILPARMLDRIIAGSMGWKK